MILFLFTIPNSAVNIFFKLSKIDNKVQNFIIGHDISWYNFDRLPLLQQASNKI